MNKIARTIVIAAMAALLSVTTFAQENKEKPRLKYCAVIVRMFEDGKVYTGHKEPPQAFDDTLAFILKDYKMVDSAEVQTALKDVNPDFYKQSDNPNMTADPKDLLQIGKKLDVDMIVYANYNFHAYSVVTLRGTETKTKANLNLVMVDVNAGDLATPVCTIEANNQTKVPDWMVAAGWLTFGFNWFSGGAKTGPIAKAASNALIVATDPYVKSQKASDLKIR